MKHIPVMVDQVLNFLLHDHTEMVCDATVGCGEHAREILNAHSKVELIGIDRDADALEVARVTLAGYGARVRLEQATYDQIGMLLGGKKIDGVLLDLGVSSLQLDTSDRGFSHRLEGPLDMRMSQYGRTAQTFIDDSSVEELAGTLRKYGEVTAPFRIARAIKRSSKAGRLISTTALKEAVAGSVGRPAPPSLYSKVFQAIRIAVNDELGHLERFLDAVVGCLRQNARVVFISYHSLEDRMIKNFLRRESSGCICPPKLPACVCGHVPSLEILTSRIVKPSPGEIQDNPRARSARLRAARVLG